MATTRRLTVFSSRPFTPRLTKKGKRLGRPQIHVDKGQALDPVAPLATAAARRREEQKQARFETYLKQWAPVVAAFVEPFITRPARTPKPLPPPEPPRPFVQPPGTSLSPRRVFVELPRTEEIESAYGTLIARRVSPMRYPSTGMYGTRYRSSRLLSSQT